VQPPKEKRPKQKRTKKVPNNPTSQKDAVPTAEEEINPKWERALVALTSHPTVTEAARALGIRRETLSRYNRDPKFRAAFREYRRATYSQSTAPLATLAGVAVAEAQKILLNPRMPAGVRVRLIEIVLNHAKADEKDDLDARLDELEEVHDDEHPGWRTRRKP